MKVMCGIVITCLMLAMMGCSKGETEPPGSAASSEQPAIANEERPAETADEAPAIAKHEEPSFTDPEAAIYAFVEAAKTCDLDQVLAMFALQEYVEGYNADSELAKDIPRPSLDQRNVENTEQIMAFYMGLNASIDEEVDINEELERLSAMNPEDYLDAQKYSSLEVLRIDLPEQESQLHDERIAAEDMSVRMYGAEGWDYRTALLSTDECSYYCGFRFSIYDGEYKLMSFSCPLVSFSAPIATLPCTEEEYLDLLEGLPS